MLAKQLIKILAISLGLLTCLVSYADDSASFMNPSAYYAPNYDQQYNSTTLPKPTFAASHGFFISLGGSYTYMKLPDFTYGGKFDNNFFPTASPAFRFHNRISTLMPSIAVGKYFYNNHFLPFLFGQTIGIRLEGSYWSDKNSNYINSANNAYFTPIDGSNKQDSVVPTDRLQDIQFSVKNRFWYGGAFLTGQAIMGRTTLAQFTREFRIGFIYNNLHQDLNFNATRVAFSNGQPLPQFNRAETLSEITNTNYYGAQIGNTFTAAFNPNVAAFIKGDIALVRAKTNFDGHQVVGGLVSPPFPGYEASVSNSTAKTTYLADVGGGLTFHASGFPVNLTLAGGVQFFGYVPKIVNPESSTNSFPQPTQPPAKVIGTTAINPYATLQLTVPF